MKNNDIEKTNIEKSKIFPQLVFPLEKHKNKIIEFIRNKINESNASGAIIGLSGGIDSTLVAHLTVEALGKDSVIGIHLPDSNLVRNEDKLDAEKQAKSLGIEFKTIDISEILNSFMDVIPDGNQSDNRTKGNLKARIRMAILYFYANSFNKMVIGTGNRTEILLGYYTKYGDGGVDILPIGNLYKTEVRALSRYLGISEEIISKAPSAGLWEGQTDEEELGLSYELIDQMLIAYENNENLTIIQKNKEISDVKFNNILSRIPLNLHKRKTPPNPIA
ncbi:MAG: NAD+ synthase [Methanosarcinales archaeon]|nr:NAD+ synthase [Methanosarcinales archaeon]